MNWTAFLYANVHRVQCRSLSHMVYRFNCSLHSDKCVQGLQNKQVGNSYEDKYFPSGSVRRAKVCLERRQRGALSPSPTGQPYPPSHFSLLLPLPIFLQNPTFQFPHPLCPPGAQTNLLTWEMLSLLCRSLLLLLAHQVRMALTLFYSTARDRSEDKTSRHSTLAMYWANWKCTTEMLERSPSLHQLFKTDLTMRKKLTTKINLKFFWGGNCF